MPIFGECMHFHVKLGDSELFEIPKITCHKEKIMPDHGICEKLASMLDQNQNEIMITPEDISSEELFKKILHFSFNKSNEKFTISRREYKDLDKVCTYFNLDEFKEFVKGEFGRKDFFSLRWLGFCIVFDYSL